MNHPRRWRAARCGRRCARGPCCARSRRRRRTPTPPLAKPLRARRRHSLRRKSRFAAGASAARARLRPIGRVCRSPHAQAAPLGSKQPVAPKDVMEQSIPPAAEVHASLLHLVPQIPWKPGFRRTGLIGRKVGMAAVWDEWGQRHPVTVIEVRLACVVALPARLVPSAVRVWVRADSAEPGARAEPGRQAQERRGRHGHRRGQRALRQDAQATARAVRARVR
jgi:hypothetical protein